MAGNNVVVAVVPKKAAPDHTSLIHKLCHCQGDLPAPPRITLCGCRTSAEPRRGAVPATDMCVVCVTMLAEHAVCKLCGVAV